MGVFSLKCPIAAHCVTDVRSLKAYIAYCKARDPALSCVVLPRTTKVWDLRDGLEWYNGALTFDGTRLEFA